MTHRAMATTPLWALTGAIAIEAATAWLLPHREVRRFSLGDLSFRTRQGRANQRPVHRPFVIGATGGGIIDIRRRIGFSVDRWRRRRRRGDGVGRFGRLGRLGGFDGFGGVEIDRLGFGLRLGGEHTRFRLIHAIRQRGGWFAATRRGHFGVLVLVLGVARRATRLLHVVLDHRDHRVIGDAALARTIVVQNVTEPNPALLHELPRSAALAR
jgi:hypothetical protein